MAGHMGDRQRTQQNLEVVRTDAERGLIFVKGSVPGSKNGWLMIKDAVKVAAPEGLPFPGAVIDRSAPKDVAQPEAEVEVTTTAEAPASDENKEG